MSFFIYNCDAQIGTLVMLAIDLAGLTKPSEVASLIRSVLKDYELFVMPGMPNLSGEIEVKTSRTLVTPELALKRAEILWRGIAEDMGMQNVKELPNKQVTTLDAKTTFQTLVEHCHNQVKSLTFETPPNPTNSLANLEAVQQLEQLLQLSLIFSKLNNPRVYEVTGDLGVFDTGKIVIICGEFKEVATDKDSSIICQTLLGEDLNN